MTKAEQRALEFYPENGSDNWMARPFFQDGYEQAEKDLGWHSVDECLPPMDEEVIALFAFHNAVSATPMMTIGFAHIVDKRYCEDYDGWNVPDVKYWMPLPKIEGEEI